MITELKIALTCVYIGAAVAVPFVILLPRLEAQWYRRMMTVPAMALCTLVWIECAATSILFFALGHPYLGGFLASMATTGLFVLSISALRLLMQTPPHPDGGWVTRSAPPDRA